MNTLPCFEPAVQECSRYNSEYSVSEKGKHKKGESARGAIRLFVVALVSPVTASLKPLVHLIMIF
jgi:hypothetical protein